MFRHHVSTTVSLALAVVLAGGLGPAAAAAQPQVATLVDVRAAQHETYDRLVFEFAGPLPADYDVRFVSQVLGDASGAPIPMVGDALLRVRFSPAVGHNDSGQATFGAPRRTFALPNLIQVNEAGDFEAVLSFGVSLAQATAFDVFTLTNPSRVVIDIDNQFRTVGVQVYFIDNAAQQQPRAVSRPVIPPATARGALQRLFAGPTQQELADKLAFVDSDAGGFATVTITDGVARVLLTDDCASHGATTTIANEIVPTLKQFTSVQWVKILDPAGQTETPDGAVDSIPYCLEP
jgi:hypothetical protein